MKKDASNRARALQMTSDGLKDAWTAQQRSEQDGGTALLSPAEDRTDSEPGQFDSPVVANVDALFGVLRATRVDAGGIWADHIAREREVVVRALLDRSATPADLYSGYMALDQAAHTLAPRMRLSALGGEEPPSKECLEVSQRVKYAMRDLLARPDLDERTAEAIFDYATVTTHNPELTAASLTTPATPADRVAGYTPSETQPLDPHTWDTIAAASRHSLGPALLTALRHPDPEVRRRAVASLDGLDWDDMGPAESRALTQALKMPSSVIWSSQSSEEEIAEAVEVRGHILDAARDARQRWLRKYGHMDGVEERLPTVFVELESTHVTWVDFRSYARYRTPRPRRAPGPGAPKRRWWRRDAH